MKRKIFSKLLMGAFLIASVSMFVSCKDYDDDISAVNADVSALKTQLASLESALNTAKQDAATAHATFATKAELAAAQKSLEDADAANAEAIQANVDAINALKDAVAKAATVAQLEQAQADLKALIDAQISPEELEEALKAVSARIDAVDEGLNTLTKDVAGLKEWKESVEGGVASVLADWDGQKAAVAALQAAIEGKADAATVAGIVETLANKADASALASKADVSALEGKADASAITTLTESIEKLNTALAGKLDKGSIDGLANQAAVEAYVKKQLEAYSTPASVTAAITEALKQYTSTEDLNKKLNGYSTPASVTETLKAYYTITETNKLVNDAKTTLNSAITDVKNAAITEAKVKELAKAAADKVSTEVGEDILTLNVFVNRALNSISLVPQLFIDGIEAIEFKSLQYTPIQPGTSGLTDNTYDKTVGREKVSTPVANAKSILVDNGTAEAFYRLNPAIVDRASLDEENIEFLAATANTREATVTSPVKFNGIEAWNYKGQKGLIKVNLKKTITTSLNLADNNIYIVALKVPRLADAKKGIESADIVSENSRLVENILIPRIARLKWDLDETINNIGNVHHYTDSVRMWNTDVDKEDGVYAKVNYNETFDVRSIVTGCNIKDGHAQITKEQLKGYGLTFRFAIAGTQANGLKAYGAPSPNLVDHSTNQQRFATIDPVTGIVSSKLPNNVTDNRACVGKEPIIRIMLVDTLNNKLVDERYMKIKWVEKTQEPVTLDTYKSETTLIPCATNTASPILWEWFITQVYAKAAINGLSQSTFEAVYQAANISYSNVTMNIASKSLLSPFAAPAKPKVEPTTNEEGDALIATWKLEPQEIANIYPSQSKTFTCKITFKSSLPTEYPDLILPWEWTIKLPALPEINGYYDNYWFTQYELHDVMPVQYNTALYDQIAAGTVVPQGGALETYANSNGKYYSWIDYKGNEGGYCVFYNNLMNAFTYEQVGNMPLFIVKNLGKDCGTWDMQFTWPGVDYIDNSKTYPQIAGYQPASQTNSPSLNKVDWETAGAYKLETTAHKQALQMVWDDGHVAWCGNPSHKQAILYADHNNPANQALLNPLAETFEADGHTPQRTHEKKIHMGIWGTLNDWNIIHVKDYDICLVEPITINASLDGAFEEGYVSGTAISCDDAFTMTDFRGYEVAATDVPAARQTEWNKFRSQLYKYYEVGEPTWNLNDVRYGMSWTGANVKANDALTYANALTAAQIKKYTNDNIVLSVEKKNWAGVNYLVFKNNGGSNVEEEVNVFIPVSVTYGFGKVTRYAKVRLYPKGKVASGVTIVAYPGNN